MLGNALRDEDERKVSLVLLGLSDLVKVSDDLVQEPQAFQALLVDIALGVKFFEIRHRGEHHTHTVIGLVVEVLSGKTIQNKYKKHSYWFTQEEAGIVRL